MLDFEIELQRIFLQEATILIENVEECFLDLENNPSDPDVITKIFRLAHNLKGSAAGVGLTEVGEFTHHLESLLLMIKEGKIIPDKSTVGLLLRSTDHIAKMVGQLKNDLSAKFDSSGLIREIEEAIKGRPQPDTAAIQSVSHKNNLQKKDNNVDIPGLHLFDETSPVPDSETKKTPQAEAPTGQAPLNSSGGDGGDKKSGSSAPPQKDDDGIRVSLTRVQKLIDFVGEIVILQSVLRDHAIDAKHQGLKRVVDQVGKVTKEVQDISMSLRMVPAKPIFQKLQRIVRDTSQALKKDIQFITSGSETELDKNLLEKIGDPLVHLIRNACDHGIEPSDERLARGKSAAGKVTLNAYRQSGKLVFEVKDDGGGLDPAKLVRIAKSKGVIGPDVQLSDKEAMQLIFAPGFSTAPKVTDISGRGVGMDVVRTNLEQMQGTITIDSQIGIGTTFKILLPLTLAIIDGMVVSVMGEKFVIPLSQVHETVRLSGAEVQSTVGLGDILLLRNENARLYDLGHLLGRRDLGKYDSNAIAIIIRTFEQPYAVVVDDILGRYQVVTKQLGEEVRSLKGLSGCTILGDGKPALILEIDDLVRDEAKESLPLHSKSAGTRSDISNLPTKLAS